MIKKQINVDKNLCNSLEQGTDLAEKVYQYLLKKEKLIISFKNNGLLTSSFFQGFIGNLLLSLDYENIKDYLIFENLNNQEIKLVSKITSQIIF